MMKIMKTVGQLLLILALITTSKVVYSQQILDDYVSEGLKSNLVLRQKQISAEKAQIALKEATSLFFPSINFNASYLSGEGGRSFEFPVGDLMNPVYSTLNQLTGQQNFPQIKNQEFSLSPNNYYDAHIRTSLPLLNTDIMYNRSIQSQQNQIREFELGIYKRDLVKNIKTAYYTYLMALSGVKVYESAVTLVSKNLEVNQSLLKNGKGLPAHVLRSKSEVEVINAKLLDAKNQASNAQHYFNFLLNKPLDSDIETAFDAESELAILKLRQPETVGLDHREEIKLLQKSVDIYDTKLSMDKFYWIPKISAFLDLGSQNVDWNVTEKSKYYVVGVQLDFPLFNSFRDGYKIDQSALDYQYAELNQKNMVQQLSLNAKIASDNLGSAYKNYQSALLQKESAESYFKLIDSGYREGANTLIEFLDARNQLTTAQMNTIITTYQVLIALSAAERENATYQF